MLILLLGIALFIAAHLLKPVRPATRAKLTAALGENASKGVMALVIVASVVLIVIGYQQAPFINVWHPPAFLTHVNNLLMAVAAVFFTAGAIRSVVRTRIRHPQLTALKTWAVAHLLVNGDLASILLFGSMLGWGVFAVIAINKRDGAWVKPAPATMKGNLIHAVVALVLLVVMGMVHNWAGVWPFAGEPPA